MVNHHVLHICYNSFPTNEFFQLNCCRAVGATRAISSPTMNWPLETQTPCCGKHYQASGKRACKKPHPLHFFCCYLDSEFSFFLLHHGRVVHTAWDISVPTMNWKRSIQSLCCRHQFQVGSKRAR